MLHEQEPDGTSQDLRYRPVEHRSRAGIVAALLLVVLAVGAGVEYLATRPSATSSATTATSGSSAGGAISTTAPSSVLTPTTSVAPSTTSAASGRPTSAGIGAAPAGCDNVVPSSASGTRSYQNVDPVNLRLAPRVCATIVDRPDAGVSFVARCIARGDTIEAGGGGPNSDTFDNDLWIYTSYGGQSGWVSDSVLMTGDDRGDRSEIPSCF